MNHLTGLTPVNHDIRSSDKAIVIMGEEKTGPGDVVRYTDPAGWVLEMVNLRSSA